MFKLSSLIASAAVLLLSATGAFAQTCATPPSCADLGFTKTVAACTGQAMVRCPFDSSAVFCSGSSDCVTLGYDKTEADCAKNEALHCPFDLAAVKCIRHACPPTVTCSSCKHYCDGHCVMCTKSYPGSSDPAFDGKGQTAILKTVGGAASACTKFYPPNASSGHAKVGRGKWYLPSIGEIIGAYGGVDMGGVTAALGNSGHTTMTIGHGSGIFWTSTWSGDNPHKFYTFDLGIRGLAPATESYQVRCYATIEGIYNPVTDPQPKRGDYYYANNTWGSSSTNAVGRIQRVYGDSIIISAMGNLTFNSSGTYEQAKAFTNTKSAVQIFPNSPGDLALDAVTDLYTMLMHVTWD